MKRTPRNQVELYETMRDAIAYLRRHADQFPSAADVAAAVGMSPSRFEHAFAQWVGIAPKRFLSYLTAQRAKQLLVTERDVLSAAHATGLSSPGRLHDLLVSYEAVSPGEYKRGDIPISYGIHPSPFGWCVIGLTPRGICQIAFVESSADKTARTLLKQAWPAARLMRDDEATRVYARQVFDQGTGRKPMPIPLYVRGTNFQIKVWEALLRVPEGCITSYAQLARAVGRPKAVRAVGTACGQNRIAYLIPCHRVLTSEGALGGYRWNPQRKDVLLSWEAARRFE